MPIYQMFLFPTRQEIIDVLLDLTERLAKKQSYLGKVTTGPAVYGKSPADIALIERQIESLQTIIEVLNGFLQHADDEPFLSEYLVPPPTP